MTGSVVDNRCSPAEFGQKEFSMSLHSQILVHKPYYVDRLTIHYDPHEDELNAREQVRLFGRELFPGAHRAPVILMDSGLHRETGHDGDYYLEYHRDLCIGACGGRFDEHDPKYGDTSTESAASRMASWLGRDTDPALTAILEFSRRSDTSAGHSVFDLPNLVKSWWGAKLTLPVVLDLYHTIFLAAYKHNAGASVASPQPGAFQNLIVQWYITKFVPENDRTAFAARVRTAGEAAVALNVVEKTQPIVWFDAHNEKKIGSKSAFDLEGIWESMVYAGVSDEEIRRVVFTSLHAKYAEQLDWLSARAEFQHQGSYLDPALTPYTVAVIESDNNQMRRAVKAENQLIDVLIQRNSDGHTKVFDMHKRFDMSPVAARLRLAEWHAMGHGDKRLPWDGLLANGTLRHIPQWFNWKKGHYVMNGTSTAPNTKVTKLPMGKKGTEVGGILNSVRCGLEVAYRQNNTLPMSKMFYLIAAKKAEKTRRKRAAQQK